MKTSIYLLLVSLAVFFTACEKTDNGAIDHVTPTKSLSDEQIKAKVASYYSSPSTNLNPDHSFKTAFNDQFPGARDIEWEHSNGVYEVDFEIGNVDYEAWYDENALLIMYKYDFRVSELPAVVQNAIAADYPGYLIEDVEKVLKGTIVGYHIELEKGKSEINVFYKEDGTFIANSIYECDHKPGGNAGTPSVPVDNGNVTGEYTNDQINALLTQYFAAHSADVNPPAAISSLFGQQFPNARDVEWEVANEVYNVDYEIGNIDYEAWYDKNGTRLAYTYDISQSALTQVVKNAITNKYSGYRIDDTERVFVGTTSGYSIDLEKGESEIDAFFKDDGTFLIEYKYR